MADTALTLITDALLDLGVLADEETPTSAQAVGGLRKLNNLIDSLNVKKINVFGSTSYIIPLIANKAFYTIGPGGDLVINPVGTITAAYIRDLSASTVNQMDYPLYIYSDQEWADVAFKSQTANWPNWGVWFNRLNSTIQAYINPIASSSNFAMVIWMNGQLTDLLLDTVVSLPNGYKRALTALLAIELAPSYEVQVSETMAVIARSGLDDMRTSSGAAPPMKSNLPSGWWDYHNGMWRSS